MFVFHNVFINRKSALDLFQTYFKNTQYFIEHFANDYLNYKIENFYK